VLDGFECPGLRFESEVDDKLRLQMPPPFRGVMAKFMLRKVFVTSLDGVTVSLYPDCYWASVKREIREQNKDGAVIIAFAEQEGLTVDADLLGGISLPPQWPCSQRLRNQSVWLFWQETQILVLRAEPETD